MRRYADRWLGVRALLAAGLLVAGYGLLVAWLGALVLLAAAGLVFSAC